MSSAGYKLHLPPSASMPHFTQPSLEFCRDNPGMPHLRPAASLDCVMMNHHHQHQHQHLHHLNSGLPHPDDDGQLSLTQEEIRRLLDAADYAQRERALLIQALEGLSMSESNKPSSAHFHDHADYSSNEAPVLVRDEGGLFRLVSPPADGKQLGPSRCLFPASEDAEDDMESDHFRMFRFKVQLCRESRCHDWAQCPFAHPGEKAARRDPRLYRYSAVPCPDVKRNGKCNRADACTMAHGVFECWLHPSRYRTQPCKDGSRCPRKVCFFAHSNEQLRLAPAAAAAAADAASAAACAKSRHEMCSSPPEPLRRRSLQLAPAGNSPVKASSPSSILSPVSSSPPPSPPLRSTSLTPFSLKDSSVETQWLPQEQFLMEQANLMHFMPRFEGSCVNPCGTNLPMQQTSVDSLPPQSQPIMVPCHLIGSEIQMHQYPGAPKMYPVPAPQQWRFDQVTSGPAPHGAGFVPMACTPHLPPFEEEPDLKWVSDLIQDQ